MTTRYEDAQNDRSRSRRDLRDLDDRNTGEGVRRDVRQTSENIKNAGSDIVSNICGLWGNILSSVGDAVSSRSTSTRSTSDSSRRTNVSDDRESGFINCEGLEFKVSCGSPGGGKADDDSRSSRSDRDSEDDGGTRATYEDRKRRVDVTT